MGDFEFIAVMMDRTPQQIYADQGVNSFLLVFYAAMLTLCFNVGPYLNQYAESQPVAPSTVTVKAAPAVRP